MNPLGAMLTVALMSAAMLTAMVACTERRSEVHQPDTGASSGLPRVVSLSPAITESLVELGLGAALAGRTPWCTAADPSVPIVGDLNDIDAERMLAVRPDLVLVQPPRSGPEPQLATLAQREGWTVESWFIDGVDDILTLLRELPTVVAPEGSVRDAAVAESMRLTRAIDHALVPDDAVRAAGRTVLLFSIEPPMAFGRGSYLGEVLERCGGHNAIEIAGFPELSLEDLLRAAPDAVVVVGSAARAAGAATLLVSKGIIDSVERVHALDDPSALVPGPSVGQTALRLRELLREAPRGQTATIGASPLAEPETAR